MAWSWGAACGVALATVDVWGAVSCIKRRVLRWIGNVPFERGVKSRRSGTLSFDLNVSGSHYIWGLGSFQHTIGSVFEKNTGLAKEGLASEMSAGHWGVFWSRMNSVFGIKSDDSARVARPFCVPCRIRPHSISIGANL